MDLIELLALNVNYCIPFNTIQLEKSYVLPPHRNALVDLAYQYGT